MLFIITEHTTCNVCREKMRGWRERKPKWERLDGHTSLFLFLLVLLIHSQDHHEFSEESNEV